MACINTKIHIPLRWGILLIVLFFFSIILQEYISIWDVEPGSPLHRYLIIILILLLFAILRLGVSYSICDRYLETRFMGIPFRRFNWCQIESAMYIHAWKDIVPNYSIFWGGFIPRIKDSHGQIIYVTLRGCPKYVPERNLRLIHNLLHPFRTACIWLPEATKNQYLEAFKKHYPDLEMQPIDAWKNM